MMTNPNRRFAEDLCRQMAGLKSAAVVERLFELGVINPALCERLAIRTEVERRVRLGEGRCKAMEAAATDFHCSYAKVKQAIYYKPKF